MLFGPTEPTWTQDGGTIDASGIFTEDAANDRHSQYQDVQALIDTGNFGLSAIMKAKVTPIGRTKCWMGCRRNNGSYMVSYDLTGAGTVLTIGSSVSSATIISNGDGSYSIKATYSGTYSTTSTIYAVGALITDNSQTYTGTSIAAFQLAEPQLIKGSSDFPYIETNDRLIYFDQETGDGSQDATMPGTTPPDQLNATYLSSSGTEPLTISDFTYDSDSITVACLVDWDGDTSTTKVLGEHWDGATQNAWRAYLDTTGHFAVSISDDGTTTDKTYTAVTALDTNEKTLCSFTWDGTTLQLYYNDIELTTGNGELTKTVDGAATGNLHDSTATIDIGDLHYGKYYDFRLYDGAATGAEIASIASGFGVSGLPDGGTPGSPPPPTTGDYLAVGNIVVIEGESIVNTGFVEETSVTGYVGDGYIRHTGVNDFTLPPTDVIEVEFYVPLAGTYEIALRVNHDSAGANDEENDCWLDVTTANDSAGFQKWGHTDAGSLWPNLGWTFDTFREDPPATFLDKWFDLDAGSHTLKIGGRSNNWKFDRVHIWLLGTTNPKDETLPESPRAGGGGGDIPTTTQGMIDYLVSKGVSTGNIRYVNNSTGSDSNTGTSTGDAWLTIQKAANTLTAGMAVIISGAGGRFYEQITPGASGTSGNLIWYVGDPASPCIVDSSELFTASGGANWTSEGGGMYSAPYNKTRYFSDETGYFAQNPGTGLVPLSTFMVHQLIYNDQQLKRLSTANHTVEPTSLNVGECWFKTAGSTDANFDTPTEVWCRLTGDIDPDTVDMRISSDKKYLFDWVDTDNIWSEEDWPGKESDTVAWNAEGRDYLGLLNMHFKFGGCIRKKAPVQIRGQGWHLEWVSLSDANSYAFTMAGDNHTMINCKTIRSGQGPCRMTWCQRVAGTTLIEKCRFEDDNIHWYPGSWDAGFKISESGTQGTTIFRDCHFFKSNAPGLWWDIFNGKNNPTEQAFLVDRCIFEQQSRHGIFVEHNSENVIIKNSGVWETIQTQEGNYDQKLGTGIRISAAGLCTFENNAVVQNDGIGWYSKAGQDGRGPNNRDTVRNNVFINNNQDATHDIDRCEFFGGDDVDEPGTYPWSSSTIDDNVFFNTLPAGVNYFVEANTGGGWVANDTIAWFQDGTRTGGTGNVLGASAAAVVSNELNRKLFYVTVGTYITKGPQGFVHYEDLTDTGWTIPS